MIVRIFLKIFRKIWYNIYSKAFVGLYVQSASITAHHSIKSPIIKVIKYSITIAAISAKTEYFMYIVFQFYRILSTTQLVTKAKDYSSKNTPNNLNYVTLFIVLLLFFYHKPLIWCYFSSLLKISIYLNPIYLHSICSTFRTHFPV